MVSVDRWSSYRGSRGGVGVVSVDRWSSYRGSRGDVLVAQ